MKKKASVIEEKIKEIEEEIKTMDPESDEFFKNVKALNELKATQTSDINMKMAKKKSRRESIESVGKLIIQGAGVCGGVFLGLAIYGFDSTGNSATSKIASTIQTMVIKKFIG